MLIILRPIRLLMRALLAQSTPRQMSFGFALGMLIGIVPKGNLLAFAIGLVVASLRVNLGVVAGSALLFTLCSVPLDPVCDRVGAYVLSLPSLYGFWTQLYNTPVIPWTDFNNSIVMGSFLLGTVMIWPVHRLTLPAFERYSDYIAENARRFWLLRVLFGVEWADRLAGVE